MWPYLVNTLRYRFSTDLQLLLYCRDSIFESNFRSTFINETGRYEAAIERSLPGLGNTLMYTMLICCVIGAPYRKELKSRAREGEMSLFNILENLAVFPSGPGTFWGLRLVMARSNSS